MSIPQQVADYPSTQDHPEEATEARQSASQPSRLTRVPPNDSEAERCVLGACMWSRDAIDEIAVDIKLKPQDFYHPAHETIYRAILDLHGRNEPVDPITLSAELTRRGELDKVGGAPFLHDCSQAVPSASNGQWYAEILKEKSVHRRLISAGTRIAQLGYDEGDAIEAVDAAGAEVFALAETNAEEDDLGLADICDEEIDLIEASSRNQGQLLGLSTGFTDLDALFKGLKPGQLIVVAGRPGMGKSTLGMDFVRACALGKDPVPAAFFSLEMGRSELFRRVASATASVQLDRLSGGTMNEGDWTRMARRLADLKNSRLRIIANPQLSLMDIQAKARRMVQRHGVKLIVVDYLQLMSAGTSGRREQSRQEEVAQISRGLKKLAGELGVPVVALSQLNRGPEQRTDKKPMMSDLRESGAIEQDADIVILLHREDAYEKESPRAGEADLIVAKHRNGATSTITVAFQGHYSRFVDMAKG